MLALGVLASVVTAAGFVVSRRRRRWSGPGPHVWPVLWPVWGSQRRREWTKVLSEGAETELETHDPEAEAPHDDEADQDEQASAKLGSKTAREHTAARNSTSAMLIGHCLSAGPLAPPQDKPLEKPQSVGPLCHGSLPRSLGPRPAGMATIVRAPIPCMATRSSMSAETGTALSTAPTLIRAPLPPLVRATIPIKPASHPTQPPGAAQAAPTETAAASSAPSLAPDGATKTEEPADTYSDPPAPHGDVARAENITATPTHVPHASITSQVEEEPLVVVGITHRNDDERHEQAEQPLATAAEGVVADGGYEETEL